MILILLGTIQMEFKRPLVEIENLCKQGIINEKIIIQSGYTSYESTYFEMIPFIKPLKLENLIIDARLIITHAGTGSVISALKKNKKIISIARYAEFGEHVDNHQLELLDEFSKLKYIVPWYKEDHLIDLIDIVNDFKPNPYVSNKERLISFIRKSIIK